MYEKVYNSIHLFVVKLTNSPFNGRPKDKHMLLHNVSMAIIDHLHAPGSGVEFGMEDVVVFTGWLAEDGSLKMVIPGGGVVMCGGWVVILPYCIRKKAEKGKFNKKIGHLNSLFRVVTVMHRRSDSYKKLEKLWR